MHVMYSMCLTLQTAKVEQAWSGRDFAEMLGCCREPFVASFPFKFWLKHTSQQSHFIGW